MNVLTFLICICLIFIFGKFLVIPLKCIIKIIINSFLGAVLLWLVNLVGGYFNFVIGINIWTSLIAGFLGMPGVICIIIVKVLLM